MTTSVETYLERGCGRCPLGGTPGCKILSWSNELELLRKIAHECNLTETCKWGVPCYTFQNKNVLMICAFKNYCAVSFFKGSLLKDPSKLLSKPGENSQAVRLLKFVDVESVYKSENKIETYMFEAIEIEKAGLEVPYKKTLEPVPEELLQKFKEDPTLKMAFEALTPGRQRSYILFFSAPKQSKTKLARIEKCMGKILNGEGLHDKYTKGKSK